MPRVSKHGVLRYLFHAPIYLYRWRLGWLFGKRLLMLTQIGRRSGKLRHTVLEVVEYREKGPEAVVASGFGPHPDWRCNIEANPFAEVTVGSLHFIASHRFLGEEEAMQVIEDYERRNRFIAPIVRRGFSWLLGWQYHSSDADRRGLVRQLPMLAFRPAVSAVQGTPAIPMNSAASLK